MAIASLVVAILLNAVPLLGLFGLGWSPATTLVLYWCESGLGVFFVLARLLLHRAVTRKRGYGRSFAGAGAGPRPRGSWRFLSSYLGSALLGGAVTAFFFGLMVFAVFKDGGKVSPVDLGKGLVATGTLSLLGLFLDARRIGDRPFAWARQIAQGAVSKFGLLVIALLLGGGAYAVVHRPVVFYAVFVLLKLVSDIHDVLVRAGGEGLTDLPGRFNAWMAARLGGQAAENVRRADRERAGEERRLERAAKEDEMPLEGEGPRRRPKRREGRKP